MSLNKVDARIASEVFCRHSKRDFAFAFYDTSRATPYTYTGSATLSIAAPTTTMTAAATTTHYITTCKAEVAGLDQSAFYDALHEFLEMSRLELFKTLATVEETE